MMIMKPEGRGICQDYCEPKKRVMLYEDPRSPPLDTKPCLCRDCLMNALQQMIEEGEGVVSNLGEQMRLLRASERKRRDPQKARRTAKEAQKGKEVVDCVMRILILSPSSAKRGDEELAAVVEAAVQMTRDQLADVQAAHAKDRLMINYIMEDKS